MTTMNISRRAFLGASAAAAALTTLGAGSHRLFATGTPAAHALAVETRTLDVLGRAATVYGIRQPNGTHGLFLEPGERFLLDLANRLDEPTIIHWHGQTPPADQDGVADDTRPLLMPGQTQRYDFAARPGTHWMHSHQGLQEQQLMAAPLIVRSEEDRRADMQEVTLLLHDFTFRDPMDILAGLQAGEHGHANHGGGNDGGHGGGHGGHGGHGAAVAALDLNDVEYDAYLANDRTLDDPEVVAVERSGRVRLRIINGATATAFHIDTGALEALAVAVDGNPIAPVAGRRFPLSMGQRIDLVIDLPDAGAWPILALREGETQRTGIILATPGADVRRIGTDGANAAPPLAMGFEATLRAATPLADRPVDRALRVGLGGTMTPYEWPLIVHAEDTPHHQGHGGHGGHGGHQGHGAASAPAVHGMHGQKITVRKGQRIALTMGNMSDMAHPMHLHGHHFQVVNINGTPVAGAVRDTVLVTPRGHVTVVFDADNPGSWPFHCHNLYHFATGMALDLVVEA